MKTKLTTNLLFISSFLALSGIFSASFANYSKEQVTHGTSSISNKNDSNLETFVKKLFDEITSILHDTNTTEDEKVSKTQRLMRDNIATKDIARAALGGRGKKLTPQQRAELEPLVIDYIVNFYGQSVKLYKNQHLGQPVIKKQGDPKEPSIVTMKVINNNKEEIKVLYKVIIEDDNYKIADIKTNNISIRNTITRQFNNTLGAADGFIKAKNFLLSDKKLSTKHCDDKSVHSTHSKASHSENMGSSAATQQHPRNR